MKTFKVENTITQKTVVELLISALEGGSNSWAHVLWDESNGPEEETLVELDKLDEAFGGYRKYDHVTWCWGTGKMVFVDKEEWYEASNREDDDVSSTDDIERFVLNEAAIERGIQVFAQYQPNHLADVINENADATTGDVFLQCCLFPDHVKENGEVVYG